MTALRAAFVASPLLPRVPASRRGVAQPPRHGARPPRRLSLRRAPRATLTRDLLAGPSNPPHPRPLASVVVLSSATGLLWYGWYKFCVEEELRATLASGPGGYVALGPFGAALVAAAALPAGGPAEAAAAFAVAWIVGVQYGLYGRINTVCEREGLGSPLTPAWVVVPGFNLVVGLRSIHFLAKAWGSGDDWVVERFPFLGKDTLGVVELLTTPKLWIKL